MRRVLVDVNVVLDVLLARAPHAASSTACLAAIESRAAEGLLSAHAVTTISYLVERALGRKEARRAVEDLTAIFTIAAVNEAVIRRALALELVDFEDAVTAAAAEASACDAIVSRDLAGFAASPVPAIEPALWLALLDNVSGPASVDLQERPAAYVSKRRRLARRR